MLILRCLAVVGLALTMSACATMIRGTKDTMVVETDPQGARVTTTLETPKSEKARRKNPELEPIYYGCPATPCEFEMPRRSLLLLTIEKEGYEPVTVGVDSGFGKRALVANLAGSGGGAVFMGVSAGVTAASLSSIGAASANTGASAAAGAVTLGIALIPLGIDAATGAMLNLTPNPIQISLPPEGTQFEPDPNVEPVRAEMEKRAERRAQKKAQKEALKNRR